MGVWEVVFAGKYIDIDCNSVFLLNKMFLFYYISKMMKKYVFLL